MPERLTPAVDIAALRTQFDLSGQVAFVPGGYGALGQAICWALAVHGARVAVAGPSAESAARLAGELAGEGFDAGAWTLDASNVSEISRVVGEVSGELGEIDVLVNCVGIQQEQGLLEVTEETFDHMYRTNLKSAMFLAQAVARRQVARGGGGRHIHLLSVRSKLALRDRGYSAYCSTKGGLLMLVRQHAMEPRRHRFGLHRGQRHRADLHPVRPHQAASGERAVPRVHLEPQSARANRRPHRGGGAGHLAGGAGWELRHRTGTLCRRWRHRLPVR